MTTTTIKKKNDCLLDSFTETFNMFNATLYKLKLYIKNETLIIDLYMKLSYPRNRNLKISFYGIKEYCFYWNESYYFYNIASYKFFKTDNLFYISLDPDGEDNIKSQNDQDFILCEKIEGIWDNVLH